MIRLRSLSLLLLAAPLAAQSNAERIATDRYSRSHDYDLLHQRIEVGGFNWDSLSLTGRVTTTLRALRPAFDSVVLDAGDLLTVSAVTERPRAPATKGADLRFTRMRDTLVVYLRRPAKFGDTVTFVVDYHGAVRNGKGLTFIEADSLPPRRPRHRCRRHPRAPWARTLPAARGR